MPVSSEVAAEPRQLLRFATIGSVDDGKSTLIGRLLYDAKGLFDDQVDAVAATTQRRGQEGLDLSLVTDGLRAEREQGITIDVAYRYFATPRRSFIIGDNPGHAQYTRNMATGASTADLAVVLVDARTGLLEQTRRHLAVAATLGIRHLVLAVNKMDLVDWAEDVFDDVVADVSAYVSRLGVDDLTAIPVSALLGDNIVDRSVVCEWYEGPTLLEHLEHADVTTIDEGGTGARVAVQLVIRTTHDGRPVRRYAGIVTGASLRPGDEVLVLPGGARSTVETIETADGLLAVAAPGRSVTVRLADDVDVTRGDVITAAADPPGVVRELEATVCWFAPTALTQSARYVVKQGTRTERVVVRGLLGRLDLDTLTPVETDRLEANDIGIVRFATAGPLVVDAYAANRFTGSFVLIDEATNATLGAGMVR
ncbi:MAG TPA: GTP-binding protein [Acidimicrobiales bacterium]|nr:GTP-binding protein [Acidimicrobiales bacterium]